MDGHGVFSMGNDVEKGDSEHKGKVLRPVQVLRRARSSPRASRGQSSRS